MESVIISETNKDINLNGMINLPDNFKDQIKNFKNAKNLLKEYIYFTKEDEKLYVGQFLNLNFELKKIEILKDLEKDHQDIYKRFKKEKSLDDLFIADLVSLTKHKVIILQKIRKLCEEFELIRI